MQRIDSPCKLPSADNFFQNNQDLKVFYDFIDFLEIFQTTQMIQKTKSAIGFAKIFAFLKNNPNFARSALEEWYTTDQIQVKDDDKLYIKNDKMQFKKDKHRSLILFSDISLPFSHSLVHTTLAHYQQGFSYIQVSSFVPTKISDFHDDDQIYLVPQSDNNFIFYWKNNEEICQKLFNKSDFKNIEPIQENLTSYSLETSKNYLKILNNKELLQEIREKICTTKEEIDELIDKETQKINIFLTVIEEALKHFLNVNTEFPKTGKDLINHFLIEFNRMLETNNFDIYSTKNAFELIINHKTNFNFYSLATHKKIYVAGISLYEVTDKIKMLTDELLPSIYKNAVELMGNDVVIIVTLPEYELMDQDSFDSKKKKPILKLLSEKIGNYKNLILIPGSFFTYRKMVDYPNLETIRNKIIGNYKKNGGIFNVLIANKFLDGAKALNDPELIPNIYFLQNSTYILANNDKPIKYKKTKSNEDRLLPLEVINYFIFDPGSNDKIKQVTINNKPLEIGLTICYEHRFKPAESITANPPLIEIIISASVKLKEEHLFGAVNIHIDEPDGLSIHINDQHPKKEMVGEISAFYYSFFSHSKKIKKEEIGIKHFNQKGFTHNF